MPTRGFLAVDLPPPSLLAGSHTSGLLQSTWTSCASSDDQTFQPGCNCGSVKASFSANGVMLPLTGATTSNIPRLVGQHDNIIRLDPRFVETGVARRRRSVLR